MTQVYDPSVWHISNLELTIRLVLALILGGLVGLERELGGHSAGFRTHILVSLGSAGIVLLSMYGFAEFAAEPNVRLDPSRLAAQVVSGIGFLGAGTILRTGITVSGLTTAASLWVVAAIGLTVGAGFYYGSAALTLLVVINLFLLNKFERKFSRNKRKRELVMKIQKSSSSLNKVVSELNRNGLQISKMLVENDEAADADSNTLLIVRIQVKLIKPIKFEEVIISLATIDGVFGLETGGESL
ncbi:MgtC family membrane protein [Paenibacillus baekrokdamisoli]|uniref:MgtC family membrane protein n=1 Tax=Paenibacillus baekrokdamisoli TaxID=1712516 RepID=A0A3G9ITM7_9BACL|nr:MgtC/SapB family protein [Paenibacillus baekrokdamisoli]MBB3070835.1 putative Mg2+ transporter-C (MgtC) family protein [Paenibacillus baekrokdamisoli]BBH22227.1 MgtC family membrane protein [Paenibacillus baekrokdamisoli]